uniref:Uncharacterized protein n=1 Tax=Romanomermis culicivorax TaxID=13658 RepID=A0A915HHQ4_ROMCU
MLYRTLRVKDSGIRQTRKMSEKASKHLNKAYLSIYTRKNDLRRIEKQILALFRIWGKIGRKK